MSVLVLSITEGNEWVRSTQGEIKTAPAGAGKPQSLMRVSRAKLSPPPAESPAMISFDGSTGLCLRTNV